MSRSEPPSLPIPLAPHEIPTVYDTRPTKAFDGKYGAIVAEPRNNRYGVHKVLNRADGLSVVLDTTASLGRTMPVFRHEADARGWAYAHRGAVADDDDDDDDDALLGKGGCAPKSWKDRGARLTCRAPAARAGSRRSTRSGDAVSADGRAREALPARFELAASRFFTPSALVRTELGEQV